MEKNHHDDTGRNVSVENVLGIERHPNHLVNQQEIKKDQNTTTNEAEVFSDN